MNAVLHVSAHTHARACTQARMHMHRNTRKHTSTPACHAHEHVHMLSACTCAQTAEAESQTFAVQGRSIYDLVSRVHALACMPAFLSRHFRNHTILMIAVQIPQIDDVQHQNAEKSSSSCLALEHQEFSASKWRDIACCVCHLKDSPDHAANCGVMAQTTHAASAIGSTLSPPNVIPIDRLIAC